MSLFETERLTVRDLENTDLDSFYDMQRNANVMRFIKPEMSLEESKKELERFIGYYHNPSIYFNIWAVETSISKTFLGICGVYENAEKEMEIAYRLREQFWGKGYGREMALGLIQYCFEQTNLDELRAYVRAKNSGSIRILEQTMHYKGQLVAKETQLLEYVYELKKEDWLAKR